MNNGYETEEKGIWTDINYSVKNKFVFHFRKCEGGGYTSFNKGCQWFQMSCLLVSKWSELAYLHLSLLGDLITSTEKICHV